MTEVERVVVDASAVVDLLLGNESGAAVGRRIRGCALEAPAHMEAEVLSALGRLERAGSLTGEAVELRLERLAAMPVARQPVASLLPGAWRRRSRLRLLDALYVELAERLRVAVVTTDDRLARASTRAIRP